jgi:hypothetical protein
VYFKRKREVTKLELTWGKTLHISEAEEPKLSVILRIIRSRRNYLNIRKAKRSLLQVISSKS